MHMKIESTEQQVVLFDTPKELFFCCCCSPCYLNAVDRTVQKWNDAGRTWPAAPAQEEMKNVADADVAEGGEDKPAEEEKAAGIWVSFGRDREFLGWVGWLVLGSPGRFFGFRFGSRYAQKGGSFRSSSCVGVEFFYRVVGSAPDLLKLCCGRVEHNFEAIFVGRSVGVMSC